MGEKLIITIRCQRHSADLRTCVVRQIYLMDKLSFKGIVKNRWTFSLQQLNNDFFRGSTPYFSINSIKCTII